MSTANLNDNRHLKREESTHTLDLTSDSSTPMPGDLHYSHVQRRHYRSHPSFNSAYHRIVSRQEREYDRDNPGLVRERIDVAEEHRLSPIRERALLHVTRAYIAVGYTHATLTIIVCFICSTLLLAVSYSVASDVSRKTRDRASHIVSAAAECAARLKQNHCVIDGDHISHNSHEMAVLCKQWYQCARKAQFAEADARSAKVWAETLADIANTFAERLSTTAIAILAVLFIACSIFFRSSFTFLRSRVVDDSIMAPPSEASYSSQLQPPLLANSLSAQLHRPRHPTRLLGYKGSSQTT